MIWPRCFNDERLKSISSTEDPPQALTEHLEELRWRIIACLAWTLVFSAAAYSQVDHILNWLAKPVGEFVFTAPTEAFFIELKISLGVGVIAAFPIFLYQIWKYVGIALQPKERSFVLSVLPFSFLLFLLGLGLALFGVVPIAVKFLLGFSSTSLRPMISLGSYLSFVFWMIIGFGVLFQLPMVVVALTRSGLVEVKKMASYRRHVLVGVFLAAAMLTPGPDVFSQLLLAVPAYLLFEVSLLISRRPFSKKTFK